MRTSKPITTVSYNTPEYLTKVLNEHYHAKMIAFWFFVPHKAEIDEKKDHIHVYIESARLIDTEYFRDTFKEFDPEYPDMPLSVLPFRTSDFSNAFLYFIHDPDYLASKNQSRFYRYTLEDIVTSDQDYLIYMEHMIDRSKLTPLAQMRSCIESGMTWEEYFLLGHIPIQQILTYQSAFRIIESNLLRRVDRNGRKSHSSNNHD